MRRAFIHTLALALVLPATAFGQSIAETLGGTPGGGPLGDTPGSVDARNTSKLFSAVISEDSDAELQMFLAMMPKGADLHHHYSGSIYVETYLEWAKEKGWKIDPATLLLDTRDKIEGALTIDEVYKDIDLYRRVLSAWSIKDYDNQLPPDSAFFKTFAHFGPISTYDYQAGLQLLRDRAIEENVLYIETMLSGVRFWSKDEQVDALLLGTPLEDLPAVLEDIAEGYVASSKFRSAVSRFVDGVEENHAGIDSDDFVMRYQSYATRDTTPSRVFGALTAAFAAAEASDLIVGVNMVGAENGRLAIRDYQLQMRMFQVLRQRYPNVKVALHAGELTKGMVPPRDLRFHIREAVEVAGASRIGHAIDLPYETDPLGLMDLLKRRDVAVELNLTSNEFILGVKGSAHPFKMFALNDVPMVVATDDSGVSRNDLSHEFSLLVDRYGLSYEEIKDLVYNSIRYSFLPDSEKATLKSRLDDQFDTFEDTLAKYAEKRAD